MRRCKPRKLAWHKRQSLFFMLESRERRTADGRVAQRQVQARRTPPERTAA